jgi:hypothetical protein
MARGAYASVSHPQYFFLRSFRHSRAFGLVRRQARAAAGLCVAFSGPLHSDRRLSHPVFARVVLAENLADLFGKSFSRSSSSALGPFQSYGNRRIPDPKPLRTPEEKFEHAELEKNALDPTRQFVCQ